MSAITTTGLGTGAQHDRRGSWLPSGAMITTRIMELRKRRGLMAAMGIVNIGIPAIFLTIRLVAHAVAPKSYGPAGGYDVFTSLVAGVLFVFGFIVAAAVGCTAGSIDLTEGMFRHLVITGRSRLALYFARIPAGLAIVIPMVATGFVIVCAVCVFAAPTTLHYQGIAVPAGLSEQGFENWAAQHPADVVCGFPYRSPIGVACGIGPNGTIITPPGKNVPTPNSIPRATLIADAVEIARADFANYKSYFLSPPVSLMIKSGLWIELEAIIGFVVGLGLASLMGQRTVPVILMIVLEIILTPVLSRNVIPHLVNVQRGIVGLAVAHLEPGGLPQVFGGRGDHLVPESTTVAIVVIAAWLVGWTALGAWRMATRDA